MSKRIDPKTLDLKDKLVAVNRVAKTVKGGRNMRLAALVVVGAIFLLRSVKYHTNEQYRNDVDIQTGDERNKYLSMKAWGWAGYLFVVIAAVGTIGFKFADKEELMMLCSGAVCLIVFLYWISYIILLKKY